MLIFQASHASTCSSAVLSLGTIGVRATETAVVFGTLSSGAVFGTTMIVLETTNTATYRSIFAQATFGAFFTPLNCQRHITTATNTQPQQTHTGKARKQPSTCNNQGYPTFHTTPHHFLTEFRKSSMNRGLVEGGTKGKA
jgi:hypothetical protein